MAKSTSKKIHPGERLEHIRHSLAHVLASAVLEMFPKAQLGVGPVIENGFFYDFRIPRPFTPEDLKKLENRMRALVREGLPFERQEMTTEKAKVFFKKRNQPFKVELIKDIEKFGTTKANDILNTEQSSKKTLPKATAKKNVKVSLYKTGTFIDLCRGGHVLNTKEISPESFKLDKMSGAYWRGDEKKPQLQRIYGLAFASKQELEAYVHMREEAQRRDHRKLGPELELFMFHETAPGMPYWLPKGVLLYNQLVDFWRKEHTRRNYYEIVSPILNKKELYVTSGHYEHYWQDMFTAKTTEGEEYGVKAMNCPNAMVIFGSKARSYKDLPLRFSDTDSLHRNELSGTLNGLLRVREFRQDDAHIFLEESDIGNEYERVFEIVERFYSVFNMSYSFRLGTRPAQFMGDVKTWNKAEDTLKKILKKSGKVFSIAEKDGAFYGPKVDILMKDVLGREWQMGTVQLDFQQPRRFKLAYTGADGKAKTPVAIHRVIYGSLERFIGILIEHFAGAFPLWLAPVQVVILPVGEKFEGYAKKLQHAFDEKGIRVEVNTASETLSKRIREAELQKIPYVAVVGEREMQEGTVSVRAHGAGGKKDEVMSVDAFIEKLLVEVDNKS